MVNGTTFAFINHWSYWRETWAGIFLLIGLLLKSHHLNIFLILFAKPYRKYVKLFSQNLKFPLQWILALAALILSTYHGHFVDFHSKIYFHSLLTILMFLIGWGIWRQTTHTKEWVILYNEEFNKSFHKIAVPLIRRGARLLIILIMMVVFSYIWGFSAQKIVTGMGILGIIVSLSSQDLMKNTFSAFLLLFNNVFDIGDWIQIGQTSGSVEDVNLRFTKIKTLDHGLVVIPNSTIANSNLTNWSRQKLHLIQFQFTLDPNCSPDQLYKCVNHTKNKLMLNVQIVPHSVVAQISAQQNTPFSVSYRFDLRTTDSEKVNDIELICYRDIAKLFNDYGIKRT